MHPLDYAIILHVAASVVLYFTWYRNLPEPRS